MSEWQVDQGMVAHILNSAGCCRQWISVEDRLPEKHIEVIFYAPDAIICYHFGMYNHNGEWFSVHRGCLINCVTHWQPLPDPPE